MRIARAGLLALALLAQSGVAVASDQRITFTLTTPRAGNRELARRLLSPLENFQLAQKLAGGARLRDQPVDLAQETFLLHVPPHAPAKGYGLIVFVPPQNGAILPDGWAAVLDERGVIFVCSDHSGNDQSVLARREPLALLAEANVAARYPLDPARIVIAGFSGGSRVALRLALAYPDVFRGAILDAGSDAVGTKALPLPPSDLMARAQETTRFVFFTGDNDGGAVASTAAGIRSLAAACVFHTGERTLMGEGHDPIGGASLSEALDLIDAPLTDDPGALAGCRARLKAAIDVKLAQIRADLSAHRPADARNTLAETDAQYGGLAAAEIAALAAQLSDIP